MLLFGSKSGLSFYRGSSTLLVISFFFKGFNFFQLHLFSSSKNFSLDSDFILSLTVLNSSKSLIYLFDNYSKYELSIF